MVRLTLQNRLASFVWALHNPLVPWLDTFLDLCVLTRLIDLHGSSTHVSSSIRLILCLAFAVYVASNADSPPETTTTHVEVEPKPTSPEKDATLLDFCDFLRSGVSIKPRRRSRRDGHVPGAFSAENDYAEEMLRQLKFDGLVVDGLPRNPGRIATPSVAGGSVRVRPARP